MFRIGKQLEISKCILSCDNEDDALEFFKVFMADILPFNMTLQQWISNLFLANKSRIANSTLNVLLAMDASNDFSLCKDKPRIHKNSNSSNNNKCNISQLPKDVFNNIGTYLPLKSSLLLSQSNHLIHKMIENETYFNFYSKNKRLELSSTLLKTIFNNNCNMQCLHKCSDISLSVGRGQGDITRTSLSYPSSDEPNCILQKIIEKIENRQNYDILWIKDIFSKCEFLYISNHWHCAFNHLPMKWIFDKNEDNNNTRLKVLAGMQRNHSFINFSVLIDEIETWSDLSIPAAKVFTLEYSKYFETQCNNDLNKVRKMQRIWIDWKDDIYGSLLQLHGNFGGIMIELPRTKRYNDRNEFGFDNLKQFFKIFHENVDWFEVLFGESNGKNSTILSQFFRYPILENTCECPNQLIKDLQTTDEQLPFETFLQKYDCNINNLPNIKVFSAHLNKVGANTFIQFLNQGKLMQLLNLTNTVTDIGISFHETWPKLEWFNPVINKIINLFDKSKMKLFEIYFAKPKANMFEQCIWQCRNNEGNDSLICNILLQFIMANGENNQNTDISIIVGSKGSSIKNTYEIVIECCEELLYRNRDQLVSKIYQTVLQSYQNTNRLWIKHMDDIMAHKITIDQHFQIKYRFQL